ncbi:MAG: CBS domain-containing protein [Rhodoferax sp.]|nr:CBS domain-containing protein [Rhodoferax sp.]
MGERLTVGEVCTRSVTLAFGSTTLAGAAALMRENHVGSLVVVQETSGLRMVVGMLTDRDVVTAVIAPGLDAQVLRVEDVMSTDLLTAREDDSLIDLMQAMRRKGVRRVPVVGPQGELVGLVALDDVLEILSQELALLVDTIRAGTRRERQLRPSEPAILSA